MSPETVVEQLFATRYSCRAFLPDPVGDDVLDRLFGMAQRTPSGCNTQPWQVHLLSGDAIVRFAKDMSAHVVSHGQVADLGLPDYAGVYADRRRESGRDLYDALCIDRGDHEARTWQMLKNFSFFGAPHSAVITTDRDLGTYGAVDCGGYVNTLMLCAHALGLGVVAQGAIAMYSDFVRTWLDLPDERLVVCAVSLGYADERDPANSVRTARAAVDDVVHRLDS